MGDYFYVPDGIFLFFYDPTCAVVKHSVGKCIIVNIYGFLEFGSKLTRIFREKMSYFYRLNTN
jgi:hypothetical protein